MKILLMPKTGQMWTAFGIMLGDLIDLAFYFVPNKPGATGLNWRLMLGSAGIPALIVCCQILWAPESPRWLIGKGRYEDAFNELCRLRFSKVQAARDLYYIHVLLEAENEVKKGRNRWVRRLKTLTLYAFILTMFVRIKEMVTIPRNRNATIAAGIVMFGQQFCGVNVIGAVFEISFWNTFSFFNSLLFINHIRPSRFLPSISTLGVLWFRLD
jgi:Sugar (and other) transporter